MKSVCKISSLFIVLFIFAQSVGAKDLVLTAPPRESAEKGRKIYAPIAKYLSQVLGRKVVYRHPGNWMVYQREMRNDRYDIIFDGPHFIAWRQQHLGHEPLLKLPGKLQFMLVTEKENRMKYEDPDSLIGKRICGISPPNLSTLSVLDYFRNPVRQPMIRGVRGGMGKVYASLEKNRCEAAVLRTTFYQKKLKAGERDELVSLYITHPMPNQGITASTRLSADEKKQIRQALLRGDGLAASRGLLNRFSGKSKKFVPVNGNEYAGYNKLLEGVILGW